MCTDNLCENKKLLEKTVYFPRKFNLIAERPHGDRADLLTGGKALLHSRDSQSVVRCPISIRFNMCVVALCAFVSDKVNGSYLDRKYIYIPLHDLLLLHFLTHSLQSSKSPRTTPIYSFLRSVSRQTITTTTTTDWLTPTTSHAPRFLMQ